MIVDVTGVVLLPGNHGRDCSGNGENPNVECCCDECDYMRCCFVRQDCDGCKDPFCPRVEQ